MNRYFKNLKKLEFVVTNACSGRCKHCSQGEHPAKTIERIDPAVAAKTVKDLTSLYKLETVMTFGGEPLLHPKAVYAVMSAARDADIPIRQVITNGYFSKDPTIISSVAKNLAKSGVNCLLLSADAFHQETIPLETVKSFALAVKEENIPIKIQPAWVVGREHNNPCNLKTEEILFEFRKHGIYENEGNVVFPEGNALKYLSEYFPDSSPENPYIEDPFDLRCISVDPNGDTLGGNLYKNDIIDIIKNYSPN